MSWIRRFVTSGAKCPAACMPASRALTDFLLADLVGPGVVHVAHGQLPDDPDRAGGLRVPQQVPARRGAGDDGIEAGVLAREHSRVMGQCNSGNRLRQTYGASG